MTTISGDTTMSELLQAYPGAQRALFARYHIGGCKSCGFSPAETLAQVCARNENIPVPEVIEHIQSSHDADARILVSPQEFAELRTKPGARILDIRSAEEHEAVKIPDSQRITQDLVSEAFSTWDKTTPVLIYDHMGANSLDVAAYFIGHGFSETKCLAGGINAYSTEVDSSLPRYFVELED